MSYQSDSASDRLAAVRVAIDRCLTSQEYGTGTQGHRQRMADLKELRAMEKELQNEVQTAAQGDSMASLAQFGREI